MTEAGAVGLQLIAPKHSAYEAYLDDSVAWMIPSKRVSIEVGTEYQWLFDGSEWWQPDEDVAAEHIRGAIDMGGEPENTARLRLAERFTLAKAAARLIEVLEQLHLRHGKVF
jgi:hypothetical protein